MPPPGKTDSIADFLGWLGRQVGHITKAAKTDVLAPPPTQTVYRDTRVEQQPHPQDPNVVLRRTVVDEIIVDRAAASKTPGDSSPRGNGE